MTVVLSMAGTMKPLFQCERALSAIVNVDLGVRMIVSQSLLGFYSSAREVCMQSRSDCSLSNPFYVSPIRFEGQNQ